MCLRYPSPVKSAGPAKTLSGGAVHYPAPIAAPADPTGQRPLRRPGITATRAQGVVVLVRPDDGGYYLLDELGAAIWEVCDGARSVEDMIAAVGAKLDIPPAEVAGDVREWLAELAVEQLLVGPD